MKPPLFNPIETDLAKIDAFDALFVDTEFTRLPLPQESTDLWLRRVRLLSLGVASLHPGAPAEFYAYRRMDRSMYNRCVRFVKHEVLPHLDAVPADLRFSQDRQLVTALQRFLAARRLRTSRPPLLVVDWEGDARLLAPLLSPTVPVVQVQSPTTMRWAVNAYFSAGRPRHNAMIDARALCEAYREFAKGKALDS